MRCPACAPHPCENPTHKAYDADRDPGAAHEPEPERATAAILSTAGFVGTAFLDGRNFYRQVYQCVRYPELVRINEGPRRGAKHPRSLRFLVAGKEVPFDHKTGLQNLADAINAHREKETRPCLDTP